MTKITTIFLLLFLLFSPISSFASENVGVFVNIRKTYLYTSADKEGKTYHTTRNEAFNVISTELVEDKLMLLIEFPYRTVEQALSGYIVFSKKELSYRKEETVKVYSEIPYSLDNFASYNDVPVSEIKFTGTFGESQLFKDVKWHNITFLLKRPYRFWVFAGDGIYRPNGERETVNNVINQIKKNQIRKDFAEQALRGIVVEGMSEKLVRDILGEPESIRKTQVSNELLVYRDQEVLLSPEKVVLRVGYGS